jgi:hypothetical protein
MLGSAPAASCGSETGGEVVSTPPAWTYSGDPASSPRDELRFLVQDTDPDLALLSDGECDYLLGAWMPRYDSVTYVASVAAAVISRKFAGIVTVAADGVTVNVSDLSKTYAAMAVTLRDEYNEAQESGATVDMSNVMVDLFFDPSIAPLDFGVGMHDNHYAGQQAYSGRLPLPAIEWPDWW